MRKIWQEMQVHNSVSIFSTVLETHHSFLQLLLLLLCFRALPLVYVHHSIQYTDCLVDFAFNLAVQTYLLTIIRRVLHS